MAPRTPSCRSGCPPWTWKRMTWCSCPNLSGEFSLWNPPVINSDPCDSYHVICHMRVRDNQWKLYMCLLYVFYNVYMYVPKNAKNTSQNNQCVCVWVWLWYLQMIFASTPANAHGFAREFGKYSITCIKDLGCNATFKWLKQLHVMLLLEVSDDRWRRRWDFSGGATL